MPYPNEHSCRLVNPGNCKEDSFRRDSAAREHNGKKYDVIYAELKSTGESVDQAYRYPTNIWSEQEAREHCNSQDSIKFEPASGSKSQMPEIHGQSWAITESGLESVLNAANEAGSVQAIMAKAGDSPRDTELTRYRGNVAVIEAIGPMFHYENILTWLFGMPATENLMQELQAAAEDPQIESIVLQIDSPGGQVGGVNELARHIRQISQEKTVKAYVADNGASAAYWIAAAASEMVVDATAKLGSIGVVFGLRQRSDNSIEIVNTSSPQKRMDPSTDSGRQQIQQLADDLAEVFINAVMQYRGLSREQVTSLQGGLAVASKAIDIGLADRIGSLESLISELQNSDNMGGKNMTMSMEDLKRDYAELFEQVKAEGHQEAEQNIEAKQKEAKDQAQQDMLALAETLFGEQTKAKMEKAVQAGLTVEQIKAAQGLFDNQGQSKAGQGEDKKDQLMNAIENGTPGPAPMADGNTQEPQDFESVVQNYMQQQDCSRGQAIKAMASKYPELHSNWINQHQNTQPQ